MKFPAPAPSSWVLRILRAPAPVPVPAAHRHVTLAILLTAVSGAVDAVSYLGLDQVFSANMTGNVVVLGMALAGGGALPVVSVVCALLGFAAGAVAAARLLARVPAAARLPGRGVAVLGGATLVLAAVTVVVRVCPVSRHAVAACVTGALGLAMGVQAVVARRMAVRDLPTVVLTMTLTSLAGDSRLAGGSGGGWARRAGGVAAMGAGAACGALLLRTGGLFAGMCLAVGLHAVAVVCAWTWAVRPEYPEQHAAPPDGTAPATAAPG